MTATRVTTVQQTPCFDSRQIEYIPTPTVLLDSTGGVLAMNTRGAATLATPEPGSPLSVLAPSLLRAACEQLSQSHPDTRALITIETACKRHNGTWFDAELTLGRVHDDSGRIVTLVRDTTRHRTPDNQTRRLLTDLEDTRHRLESQAVELVTQAEALHASEESLRMVVEAVGEGYWDWDIERGQFDVSDRFITMLGYRPGELDLSLERWPELVHPEDWPLVQESLRRHLRGDSPAHQLELRARTADGGWRWLLTRGRIVERADDGRALRMAGTHTDIEERKRLEQAQREAGAVFEHSLEGIMVVSAEGKIGRAHV